MADETFADRQARLAAPVTPKTDPASITGTATTNSADPAAPAAQTSGYGHPVYDQIGQMFQDATGRKATQQEVSQWGTNVDGNYMNTIKGAIAGSDEAKAYQTSKNTPAVTPTAPSTPAGSTAPTSPVSATGGIPPPAAPAAPAAPAVGPPAAVTPAAPQAVGAQPDARTPAGVAASPTYTPGSFANTLQASTINPLDQTKSDAQQSSLMAAIMAHPETMDANTVAQMKEQQKEQALLLGQQNNAAYAQGAVGRGTLGGGRTDAFRQQGDQNINNAILTGNRATDLAAIATNRQDQLNALSASSSLAQDQSGRTLQGQLAKDNSNLSHAQYGTSIDQANAAQKYLGYQSQNTANDNAYSRAMGLATNAQNVYGQDLAAQFGNQSQNLDLQKFLESQSQYNQNLAAQKDQFGQTIKFNYNQLDQNGNLMQNNQLLGVK